MRAWLPEREVHGPERAGEQDIEGLNRLFAEAFTDRYRRDGLVGVRVPRLNPAIWRYALIDAGEGAMLWRDEHGDIAAFNLAHLCGREGWMGPLAVRTDRQGGGVGKSVVGAAADWLIDRGAHTVGLETMPRTVDNIGFYSGLGFRPGHLTVTLTLDTGTRRLPPPALLSEGSDDRQHTAVTAIRGLVEELAPGYDCSREILLTSEMSLGDTVLVWGDAGLDGFALSHSAPLAEGREGDEVRVLKLAARSPEAFTAVVSAVEAAASRAGIRRVAIRAQTAYADAYQSLMARGYQVRWTDLRMYLTGYAERQPKAGVLYSNWEI
jgi:GNAT superfamily N-acetyltransferase